jgi:hypothetical protein
MKKPNPKKSVKVSKAEQRIAIAKDALAQLRAEMYLAESGTYIGSELTDELDQQCDDDRDGAKPFLLKSKTPCRVCAKGALFLSTVRRYNKASVRDVMCDNMLVAENIFGHKQFDLIEAAFERWDHTVAYLEDKDESVVPLDVQNFGAAYTDDTDRLVAILENIIKNKGTFKP